HTTDWVFLSSAGRHTTSDRDWSSVVCSYAPPDVGMTSATLIMTAPTTDGSYEARFYANNGWTVLARTIFTVQGTAPPPPPPPVQIGRASRRETVSTSAPPPSLTATAPGTATR